MASALALVFWGTTRFLQGYLYNEPAERLPVRALVAGVLVGGFLTLWTFVNTRASVENKYGTFFDFNPVGEREVTAFEAVRRYPKRDERGRFTADAREETVAFARKAGTTPPEFENEATGERFAVANTGAGYLTVALLIDDGDGRKARFNANIDPKNPNSYAAAAGTANHQFDEERGGRYLDGATPTVVYAPSRWGVFAALALNGLLFVAWFAAFGPVLRYSSGHALGLAAACGAAALLVLMPLLFKLNKPKAVPVLPAAVVVPAGP
jgi:hypothetical protein